MRKVFTVTVVCLLILSGCLGLGDDEAEEIAEEIADEIVQIPGCSDATAYNYDANANVAAACLTADVIKQSVAEFIVELNDGPEWGEPHAVTTEGSYTGSDGGSESFSTTLAQSANGYYQHQEVNADGHTSIFTQVTMAAADGSTDIMVNLNGTQFVMNSAIAFADHWNAANFKPNADENPNDSTEVCNGNGEMMDQMGELGPHCMCDEGYEWGDGDMMTCVSPNTDTNDNNDISNLEARDVEVPENFNATAASYMLAAGLATENGYAFTTTFEENDYSTAMTFHLNLNFEVTQLDLLEIMPNNDTWSSSLTILEDTAGDGFANWISIDSSLDRQALPFMLLASDNHNHHGHDNNEQDGDASDDSVANPYCDNSYVLYNLDSHEFYTQQAVIEGSAGDWILLDPAEWPDYNHPAYYSMAEDHQVLDCTEDANVGDWILIEPSNGGDHGNNADYWDNWWYYCEYHGVDWYCTDDLGQNSDYEFSASNNFWSSHAGHDNGGEDGHDHGGDNDDDGMTPELVLELFDTNDDGYLSWEEFWESWGDSQEGEDGQEEMSALMDIFADSDTNADELLEISELETFIYLIDEFEEGHDGHENADEDGHDHGGDEHDHNDGDDHGGHGDAEEPYCYDQNTHTVIEADDQYDCEASGFTWVSNSNSDEKSAEAHYEAVEDLYNDFGAVLASNGADCVDCAGNLASMTPDANIDLSVQAEFAGVCGSHDDYYFQYIDENINKMYDSDETYAISCESGEGNLMIAYDGSVYHNGESMDYPYQEFWLDAYGYTWTTEDNGDSSEEPYCYDMQNHVETQDDNQEDCENNGHMWVDHEDGDDSDDLLEFMGHNGLYGDDEETWEPDLVWECYLCNGADLTDAYTINGMIVDESQGICYDLGQKTTTITDEQDCSEAWIPFAEDYVFDEASLFGMADADADGLISQDEFYAWMDAFFGGGDDDETTPEQVMSEGDSDDSNGISWDEFVELWNSYEDETDPDDNHLNNSPTLKADFHEAFNNSDDDDSDELTIDELQEFIDEVDALTEDDDDTYDRTFVCSDEIGGPPNTTIPFELVNDGNEDCGDGSDEPQDIDPSTDSDGDGDTTNDVDNWFDCYNGDDIAMNLVNNGHDDCSMGEDEYDSPPWMMFDQCDAGAVTQDGHDGYDCYIDTDDDDVAETHVGVYQNCELITTVDGDRWFCEPDEFDDQGGQPFFDPVMLWNCADSDDSGIMNGDEFSLIYNILFNPGNQLGLTFCIFDADGNGGITASEYADYMNQSVEDDFWTEDSWDELEMLFEMFDEDDSGDLDYTEFGNLMSGDQEPHDDTDSTPIFDTYHSNENGEFTIVFSDYLPAGHEVSVYVWNATISDYEMLDSASYDVDLNVYTCYMPGCGDWDADSDVKIYLTQNGVTYYIGYYDPGEMEIYDEIILDLDDISWEHYPGGHCEWNGNQDPDADTEVWWCKHSEDNLDDITLADFDVSSWDSTNDLQQIIDYYNLYAGSDHQMSVDDFLSICGSPDEVDQIVAQCILDEALAMLENMGDGETDEPYCYDMQNHVVTQYDNEDDCLAYGHMWVEEDDEHNEHDNHGHGDHGGHDDHGQEDHSGHGDHGGHDDHGHEDHSGHGDHGGHDDHGDNQGTHRNYEFAIFSFTTPDRPTIAGSFTDYSIVLANCSAIESDENSAVSMGIMSERPDMTCGADVVKVAISEAMDENGNIVFIDADSSGTITNGDKVRINPDYDAGGEWNMVRLHATSANAYSDDNPILPGFGAVAGIVALLGAAILSRRD